MHQYALPGRADAQLQPSMTAYDRFTDQMAFGASSHYQNHASYEATEPPYSDVIPQGAPNVSSWTPQSGTHDSQVFVYLDSPSDLLQPSPLIASLMFGRNRVPATLNRLETLTHNVCYKYVVNGKAPPLANTTSSSRRVDLRIQFQETSGIDAGLIYVGPWMYENVKQLQLRPSPELNRKRKVTLDSPDSTMAAKRISPTQPTIAGKQEYGSYSYTDQASEYPQALQSIDLSSMQRRLTPYGRSQNQHSAQDDSMSTSAHNFSSGATQTQALMRPPMTQSSSYSPSYTTHQISRSPGLSSITSFQISSSSSPDPANPPLVRASTLQQAPNSISTSAAASDSTFNPYAMYPNRAIIKIRGDLDTMQDDWTQDERSAKRRLVRFRGEQTGSTINTYFDAVKSDERPAPSETREKRVSCIYWEERDEYYVTSVDIIALLETLVGNRFTVEEKNRIRRNLETHHPLTVSKAKPDMESFFKVIMGFPNPKPRNIEKDVKVFPWPILLQALRKVISKYASAPMAERLDMEANLAQSASPASTAGPLPTTRNFNLSGAHSDSSSDRYTHLSSRSSTGSSAYASTLKSSLLSPSTASHSLPSQYSQASPLPTSMAGFPNSYTIPTLAGQCSRNNGRSFLGANYTHQESMHDGSHAYTNTGIGRRRSSDANTGALGVTNYPSRPRANTSFSAQYQNATENALAQMPSSVQPHHPSWDFSPFLRSEAGSISHDSQWKMPSRQDSHASQYQFQTVRHETPQSTLQ